MRIRRSATGAIVLVVLSAILFWGDGLLADVNCAQSPDGCCCSKHIGNIDCSYDNSVDIGDLAALIDYLYLTFEPLPSPAQANLDGDSRENIDMGDVTALLLHLFFTFDPLPACPGPVNHPPNTYLGPVPTRLGEYIYTPDPQTPSSGIPIQWYAEDRLDYPYDYGALQSEWRLYGPYDSATYAYIAAHFIKDRFTTPEGRIYPRGAGIYIHSCDTILTDSGVIVDCDSVAIDRLSASSRYGWAGDMLLVDTADFASNPLYNRIAISSAGEGTRWLTDGTDTLYHFLPGTPSDTTSKWWFILWVQSRDRDDSTLVDPSPVMRPVTACEPRFENDVLVVDLNIPYTINGKNLAAAQAYWQRAVAAWSPEATFQYYLPQTPSGLLLPVNLLLSHKVVILYGDDIITGDLSASTFRAQLFFGMRAGASVWLTSRASLAGAEGAAPSVTSFTSGAKAEYQYYFGATNYYFSGWEWWQAAAPVPQRIEDFEAARSAGLPGWPDLVVDTALLHSRYTWDYPWEPTLACPPEVNSIDPVPEAELLYNYDSKYDGNHPFVADTYDYHGRPAGYRLQREEFRSVVFTFTPFFMAEDANLQIVVDSVLNWLTAPHTQPASGRVTLPSSNDKVGTVSPITPGRNRRD